MSNREEVPAPDAVWDECIEIALTHVDSGKWDDPEQYIRGYNQACLDIVDAIKTRASNRATMNAIADAAQGEQK